nr:hypothetical protein LTR18_003501 [Exophiala xenobiotica]
MPSPTGNVLGSRRVDQRFSVTVQVSTTVTGNGNEDGNDSGFESTATSDDESMAEHEEEPEIDFLENTGPTTRSRSRRHTTESTVDVKGDLDDELDDDILALARKLQVVESRDNLEQLYPPQFRECSIPSYIPERVILDEFTAKEDHCQVAEDDDIFYEFSLQDFRVYRAPGHTKKGFDGKYESLSTVALEKNQPHWLIDGFLEHDDGTRRRLFAAQIVRVNIGPLEDLQQASTEDNTWVRTHEGALKNYWYRLKRPFSEYESYWTDFVWLANFLKYFVDFLHVRAEGVSLHNFKSDFWKWLQSLHGDDVNHWQSQCGFRKDFTHDVTRYSQFLWIQTYCTYKDSSLLQATLCHPIWEEIGAGQFTYDEEVKSKEEKTTVTANVALLFLTTFPHWQTKFELLEVVQICPQVEAHRHERIEKWNFPQKLTYDQTDNFVSIGKDKNSIAEYLLENAGNRTRVRLVDDLLRKIVIIKVLGREEYRYAWVKSTSRSTKTIGVVWLVLPSEALCCSFLGKIFYPIGNELMFSDSCNCDEIHIENVVEVLNASVFTDHAEKGSQLFVHCLYREREKVIVNANEDALVCRCRRSRKRNQVHTPRPPPNMNLPKMQTLSLFSGCGLFDYAFKATGFAEIVFAIDCFEMAIRSHQANDPDKKTRCEIGSVCTFLSKIASGQESMIAIDCIIAGCPCQGFSTANNYRQNRKGQKNCSLLANLLSWIEIFMPAYVVIENVPAMDSPQSAACALAKAHLVSLGYQLRHDVNKASDRGSATQRKRLIIVAAAPGAILSDAIPGTHGKGLAEVRTTGDVMRLANLPPLHNDEILSIKMPNHVPTYRLPVNLDNEVSELRIVQQIPTRPPGMSLMVAYNQGLFSRSERRWIRSLNEPQQAKGSKSFKRINPDQPFQTITTKVNLHCCRGGQLLHPVEHRALSLQEIRLAFDVPDSFILVGKVADQVKMLGNSVPWNLGASIGRQVGRCWSASLAKRGSAGTAGVGIEKEPDNAGQKISVVIPRTAPQRRRARLVVEDESDGESVVILKPAPQRRARPVVEDESDGDSESSIEYLGARPVKKARAE